MITVSRLKREQTKRHPLKDAAFSTLTLTLYSTMRILPTLSLIIAVAFVGCSQNIPLSGKVTFADDGSPVTLGKVFFMTPTTVAQAGIREDGTYTVGSMKETDGMPKGTYQVYLVVEQLSTREMGGQSENVYTSLIDSKYTNPETSGLTFNADGKTKTFDIKVERARGR